MKTTITLSTILALFAGSAGAAVIYGESFEYGGSDTAIGDAGAWSSGSSVLKYDADGGLDHPRMSGETGGAMWLDFDDARSASDSTISLPMSTLSEGDVVWYAALFGYVSGNNTHRLDFNAGTVSSIDLYVQGDGDVGVVTTLDTNVNASFDTGIDLATGTHLMLLRATKGGGGSPTDSQLDLWVNPADTSSVGALGAAEWTLDSGDGQVKWGRDTDTLSSIEATPSQDGRIDEIRVTTDFADLNLAPIPEPRAVLLGSLALLALLRRRR